MAKSPGTPGDKGSNQAGQDNNPPHPSDDKSSGLLTQPPGGAAAADGPKKPGPLLNRASNGDGEHDGDGERRTVKEIMEDEREVSDAATEKYAKAMDEIAGGVKKLADSGMGGGEQTARIAFEVWMTCNNQARAAVSNDHNNRNNQPMMSRNTW